MESHLVKVCVRVDTGPQRVELNKWKWVRVKLWSAKGTRRRSCYEQKKHTEKERGTWRGVVIEKEKEVCNADCVTVIQSAYKTVLEITIQSSHKARCCRSHFSFDNVYSPANQFLAWAKHNQISSEEIAWDITKLFCGVATVFMQESSVITFVHTFAANPFYWLHIHLAEKKNKTWSHSL